MNIVTLTTDYGCKDYYAGALKSKLLQTSDNIRIVDITHEIQPFHFGMAAFQVRNALRFFSAGAIHFIDVAFSFDEIHPYLIMLYKDQYIISHDKGVFSIILDGDQPQKLYRIYTIDFVKHPSFPAIDIFPQVLKAIVNNSIETVAETFDKIQHSETIKPTIYDNMIRAGILNIDRYENIILNIKYKEFEEYRNGRNFVINIRRSVIIDHMYQTYEEVKLRDPIIFCNANDYLEIALNEANLAGLIGAELNNTIQIDFL